MTFLATPAFAAEEPAPAAGSKADLETAKRLFNQGQIHYSLGEYDQAISQFRAAYQLSFAPGLLFNIAQAYRLKGDCRQALEIYKHFLRLAPDAPTHVEAESQVSSLEQRCRGAEAAPVPAPASPPPGGTAPVLVDANPPAAQKPEQPAAPPRWSTRGKVAAVLLGAGAAVGVAAGVVYLWNDDQYDRWRAEDQRLSAPPAGSPMDWFTRQQQNDELLRSIQRADTVDKVLAGAAVGCILSSAVLSVVFNRPQTIEANPGGMTVTWRWP